MRQRQLPTFLRQVCSGVVIPVLLAGIAGAQSQEPEARSPRVRVDPDTGLPPGMPDFRGVWSNRWIVNMADGRYVEKTVEVPFTEKGRAIYAERTDNLQKDDPNLRCWPSGLPRQAGTPYPLKIMQTPDEFVILYEGGMHTFRIIPTDGRPHKEDPWLWYGDSVGRWEGDTLVVDTIGFNDKSWLDSSGYPHGEQLHLVERFRRIDPQTLRYEVTIEDPEYYTRPWTTAWTYRFSPDMELMEYVCTENERDRERMVGS